MEALLTANKDKLYSFAFTDEEREIPPEQGDEDSGETIHETIRIYTISYNGEAYFADQVFHLSDDQKLLASQYAQNLTVLLGDGIYQGLSETEFSAMVLSPISLKNALPSVQEVAPSPSFFKMSARCATDTQTINGKRSSAPVTARFFSDAQIC